GSPGGVVGMGWGGTDGARRGASRPGGCYLKWGVSAARDDTQADRLGHVGGGCLRQPTHAAQGSFDGLVAVAVAAALDHAGAVDGAVVADPHTYHERVLTAARLLFGVELLEDLVLDEPGIPDVGAPALAEELTAALVADESEGIPTGGTVRIEPELLTGRRLVGRGGIGLVRLVNVHHLLLRGWRRWRWQVGRWRRRADEVDFLNHLLRRSGRAAQEIPHQGEGPGRDQGDAEAEECQREVTASLWPTGSHGTGFLLHDLLGHEAKLRDLEPAEQIEYIHDPLIGYRSIGLDDHRQVGICGPVLAQHVLELTHADRKGVEVYGAIRRDGDGLGLVLGKTRLRTGLRQVHLDALHRR